MDQINPLVAEEHRQILQSETGVNLHGTAGFVLWKLRLDQPPAVPGSPPALLPSLQLPSRSRPQEDWI